MLTTLLIDMGKLSKVTGPWYEQHHTFIEICKYHRIGRHSEGDFLFSVRQSYSSPEYLAMSFVRND